MSHTPGPWTSFGLDWRMVVDTNVLVVADVRTNQDDSRLIAAAPDLLDALKSIAAWSVPVDDDPDDPQTEYGEIKKFARAAIAKATSAKGDSEAT